MNAQNLNEAVCKFLHHLSMINEHMRWVYRNGDSGSDLRQEEQSAQEWARKLVEMLPTNYLDDYETYSDSILEFQAMRSCFDRLNDEVAPQGADILTDLLKSGKGHFDLTRWKEALGDFAKGLGIDKESAAAVKAYIEAGHPYYFGSDEAKRILGNLNGPREAEN